MVSDLEQFMGKTGAKPGPLKEPAVSKSEPVAPVGMPMMSPEQFAAFMSAFAGARATPKTAAEIKAEADIVRQTHAAPNCDMSDRVWITLSDNKNIARGGQFFGINGASFLLKPGKKAHVPRALTSVLDDAIEGVGITDPDTLQVVEYRQVLRYPYQVHAGP